MANKKGLRVCTTIVPPGIVNRLAAAEALFEARPGKCDLIVLPAEYVVDASAVLKAARKARVAVIVGDAEGVLGWAPGGSKVARLKSTVEMRVGAHRVAPIIDAEIFDPRVRAGVATLRPRVAVLVARRAGGARHWAGQQSLARLGVGSVRSVHANGGARDLLYRPNGEEPPLLVEQVAGITASCFAV